MAIHLDIPHIFILCAGICLVLYGLIRFRIFFQHRDNPIAYHLPMAMLLWGLGMGIFGFVSLYPGVHFAHITFITALTAGLEMLGYVHFIAIPAFTFLPRRSFIITKYMLFLFAIGLTMAAVIYQPQEGVSFSDLTPPIAIGVAFLQELALLSNTILLVRNYRAFNKLSWINAAGPIIAFICATPSGTYFYLGNNPQLLGLAGLGLLVGMILLLFSALMQTRNSLAPAQ